MAGCGYGGSGGLDGGGKYGYGWVVWVLKGVSIMAGCGYGGGGGLDWGGKYGCGWLVWVLKGGGIMALLTGHHSITGYWYSICSRVS